MCSGLAKGYVPGRWDHFPSSKREQTSAALIGSWIRKKSTINHWATMVHVVSDWVISPWMPDNMYEILMIASPAPPGLFTSLFFSSWQQCWRLASLVSSKIWLQEIVGGGDLVTLALWTSVLGWEGDCPSNLWVLPTLREGGVGDGGAAQIVLHLFMKRKSMPHNLYIARKGRVR